MNKLLVGIVLGLSLGIAGTFAYDRYLGPGRELSHVVAALSPQGKQLLAQNEAQAKAPAPPAPAADAAPNPIAAATRAMLRQKGEQKLALLRSRLNLTPDQEAAIA